MLGEQATQSLDWNNLVKAINNDECVLVLGPNIATTERNGQIFSLQELLINHLSEELIKLNPESNLSEPSNLPYVAKKLEDALLPTCEHEGEARSKIEELYKKFYDQYKFSDFPVYEALAKLPFRFVLNTNPDKFLLEAYIAQRKLDAACVYYDYCNPGHNNRIFENKENREPTNKDLISIDAPLIFNMFGTLEDADSLIITESDRLEFLDTVLQRGTNSGIPSEIAIEFTSSKEKRVEKTLVFLGFDFNKWHMRLIMHLINRNHYRTQRKLKETYALQSLNSLPEMTSFFYRRDFKVNFVDSLPEKFAIEFYERLQNQKEVFNEAPPKLNAYLIYDEGDQEDKDELATQLASLNRNELLVWDEEQIIAGSVRDDVIEEKLNQADIILLLVTPNLIQNDEIYKKQLPLALALHDDLKTTVIPILFRNCSWKNTVIGKLPTVLPRNKIALNKQEDREAMLGDTISQLEGWCKKINKLKSQE